MAERAMSAGDPLLPETQSGLHVQDLVRVRGRRWRVTALDACADCEAISLDGIDISNHGVRRTLIHPFDRPVRLHVARDFRVVTRARWTRAFLELAVKVARPDELWTGAHARIVLLPYQLEPALAVVRGLATRLLIADDVGLGKSIQAGLVIRELVSRRLAERVLILTPAGIRDQWARELGARFALDAEVVDAAALEERARAWAGGPNPWAVAGVRIVSYDFIKRPEVLRALDDTVWDVVVIDEAHGMTSHSDRGIAARALANRARFVVLLTATPHSGDPGAFEDLCHIGRITRGPPHSFDPQPPVPSRHPKKGRLNAERSIGGAKDQVVLFRRRRAEVGFVSGRKTRLIHVRPTAAERRMHELLDEYTRRVWGEAGEDDRRSARLAVIVLRKRALSSAASLAASVARRLERFETTEPEPTVQVSLPLDPACGAGDEAPEAILSAPGLSRRTHERAWLGAILNAAITAARRESKLVRLLRLLGRAREPTIVFTEYRDTLVRLARAIGSATSVAMLHGGLTRPERAHGEHQFVSGAARILLATDAAGEGLNLHVGGCRLVVNYELPWTPLRLEQRIGRVDRIGQTRPVHAVHLVSDATPEGSLLERLIVRRQRIQTALDGAATPDADVSERAVGAAVLDRESGIGGWGSGGGDQGPGIGPAPGSDPQLLNALPRHSAAAEHKPRPYRELDLRAEAEQECRRLHLVQRLGREVTLRRRTDRRSLVDQLDDSAPWVASLRISPRSGAGSRVSGAGCRVPGAADLGTQLAESGTQHSASDSDVLQAGILWIFRVALIDGAGGLVETLLLPLLVPTMPKARRKRQEVLAFVRQMWPDVRTAADTMLAHHLAPLLDRTRTARAAAFAGLVRQEQAQLEQLRDGLARPLVQLGLFDRRAAREAEAAARRTTALDARYRERLEQLQQAASGIRLLREPELVLVLLLTF